MFLSQQCDWQNMNHEYNIYRQLTAKRLYLYKQIVSRVDI